MNLYGENGLCTLAKHIAKRNYTPEWTEDIARREAASYAFTILSMGRRSRATKRYYQAMIEAFLEGVREIRLEREGHGETAKRREQADCQ